MYSGTYCPLHYNEISMTVSMGNFTGMTMALLVIALLILAFGSAQSAGPDHIFLLAGQSNMVGHGGIEKGPTGRDFWDGYVPLQCRPNPKVLRFDAGLQWEEAKEPIHLGIYPLHQRVTGVGPSMPFANRVLNLSPAFGTIGLVPCACDWTRIDEWSRGTKLYNNLVARAKASTRTGGTIAGLIWWQGGRDAYSSKDAAKYKQKLVQFFLDVRADLGTPEIVIPPSSEAPFASTVRNAQLSVDLPGLIKLDVPRMPLGPDRKHMTTDGQVLVGEKLAEAFCRAGYC